MDRTSGRGLGKPRVAGRRAGARGVGGASGPGAQLALARSRVLRAAVVAVVMLALAYVAPADVTGALGPTLQTTPAIVARQVYGGFTRSLLVTHAGDGTNRLFVVETGGKIKVVAD